MAKTNLYLPVPAKTSASALGDSSLPMLLAHPCSQKTQRCCNSTRAWARSCDEAPSLPGCFRLISLEKGHLERVHGASAPSPPSQLLGGHDARAQIGEAPALRPGRRGATGIKGRLHAAARLQLWLGLPGCSPLASWPRCARCPCRLVLAWLQRAEGSWGGWEPAVGSHSSAEVPIQMCTTSGNVQHGARRATRAWRCVAPSAQKQAWISPACATARAGCSLCVSLLLRERRRFDSESDLSCFSCSPCLQLIDQNSLQMTGFMGCFLCCQYKELRTVITVPPHKRKNSIIYHGILEN